MNCSTPSQFSYPHFESSYSFQPSDNVTSSQPAVETHCINDTDAMLCDYSSDSTMFGPTFEVGGTAPDLTLVTGDDIVFNIHRRVLIHVSRSSFGDLLQGDPDSINVPESSAEMAVVLHVAYGIPCLHLSPALDTVEKAIEALVKYGAPIQQLAIPDLPLYYLVLSYAPYQPMETYAMVGYYDLEDLAVAVSSHLLVYDTSRLSDEVSKKIGSVYLLRLLDLHQMRRDALKSIIMRPPETHSPSPACGLEMQARLRTGWAHVVADLAWETNSPSAYRLQTAFEKAGAGIPCGDCISMLQKRIGEVVQAWLTVKRSI